MKFITRELYDSMQGPLDACQSDAAERRWKSQCSAYRKQLAEVRNRLPPSMFAFCETTLHDGVIKSAVKNSADSVRLEIDATNNPWGPVGFFTLTFSSVEDVTPLEDLCGEYWLYEEVHPHPVGFDYRVLLDNAEFRVIANKVEFVEIDSA